MNTVIEWAAVLPLAIVLGAGVIATLVEAFVPRGARRAVQVSLSMLALAGALVAVVWRWTETQTGDAPTSRGLATTPVETPEGVLPYVGLVEDNLSLVAQTVILVGALLAFLIIADRSETREGAFVASAAARPGSPEERESALAGREHTEVFPLALFATGGMMAFTAAMDLLTLFIALEVLSLPLYVLTAMARRRRLLSQEASVKYFILGAFSSAVFLMGAAFIYGATGRMSFLGVNYVSGSVYMAGEQQSLLLVVGVVMLILGLLFKVGAVPFHQWTPDVYQGAPTPITGFMAAGTKAAAFVALARVMLMIVPPVYDNIVIFLWIVIIATIIVGTVMGLVQTDIKRLLAYSSIAHAGFILIGIVAIKPFQEGNEVGQAVAAILFYLLAYGVSTIGAFGVITLVRERDGEGNLLGEATKLDSWKGLGRRSPLLAAAMTVFLLSFAGIPLTGGFIGKFEVFRAGIGADATVLVVIAVIASVVTAAFYFRIIANMFFNEPETDSTAVVTSEGYSIVAIVLALIATIGLGVLPGPIFDFILGSFLV